MMQNTGKQIAEADPSVLRYFPTALYEIGCCHYGHRAPYRVIEIAAENLLDAMNRGRKQLAPTTVEHICHVGTKPNPEFIQEQARWCAIRDEKMAVDSDLNTRPCMRP